MNAAAFPMLPDLPDGIYFDLPFEVYVALPRLSASGIQDMCISPATFWARSWLNKAKAEKLAATALATLRDMPDAEGWRAALVGHEKALRDTFPEAATVAPDEKEKKSRVLGRAYHCARLEADQFHARFARKPDRADFPAESLWTGTDISDALAALELPRSKAGENVEAKALRLAAAGYSGTIFPLEMAKWKETLGGRTPIDADDWEAMLTDMERIAQSGVRDLLTGGAAEVAVLWTDGNGIRMKSRYDYLKPVGWSDLKTFDNWNGKHLEQFLIDQFRFQRHYVQGAVYREPYDLLRAGALAINGPATDEQRRLIADIERAAGEPECWFVYQEKNGIPNLLGRQMIFYETPQSVTIQNNQMRLAGWEEEKLEKVAQATATSTFLFRKARHEIGSAKADFLAYREVWKPGEPWHPWQPKRAFDDLDFPDHFLRNE